MNRRRLKLKGYGISDDAYQEMLYFCRQYHEKRQALAWKRGSGARLDKLRRDVEAIEQAALAAAEDLYPYLIDNVTRGTAYELLGIPQGRRQFYYGCRRRFFICLAQRLLIADPAEAGRGMLPEHGVPAAPGKGPATAPRLP